MKRPDATLGLRHVALIVEDLEAVEMFYTELLGMDVEWRPDEDNVYLSGGPDNLALHRGTNIPDKGQRLDHIGFMLSEPAQVDAWYRFLSANNVTMRSVPNTHRDGARSFYCVDPAGNQVQLIYHPPVSEFEQRRR